MSILVNKDQIFEYTINGTYDICEKTNSKKFKQSKENTAQLTIYYVERDFDSMSKIIEDCSIINSVTGKPLLRASSFIKKIAETYIKRVILKSETEEIDILINSSSVSKMHYDFVKLISSKWLELTSRT